MAQQANAPYEFSAQPKLVNRPNALSLKVQQQIQYRDPYREYIKIAPQNIMYDRRVVRGNTFAALVIPVNMQPESMTSTKKQRQPMRQSQQQMGDQGMQQHYQQRSDQQLRSSHRGDMVRNDWEELSDVSRQMDEFDVEPDFYIDMAPDAIFVPELDGVDKQNQLDTKSIFDFESESMPILQVLVGKALDQAQVEVTEEWEYDQLAKHKAQYKQLRESELIETQRMEAANTRKNEEQDRRVLQQRTANQMQEMAQKQVLSRVFTKDFMKYFKRDNLAVLVDMGCLRSQRELSMSMDLIPKVCGQAEYEIIKKDQNIDGINDVLHATASKIARNHKASIMREIKRQEEEALRKKQEERDRIEATKQRKERRNALREAYGLKKLTNTLLNSVINNCQKAEYNPQLTVYDVREYHPTRENGCSVIGGFVGELLIVFTALYDYMLSNPSTAEFRFTTEAIEKFLIDWMKEGDFPEGTCQIKLKDPLNFKVSDDQGNFDPVATATQIATALKNPSCHQGFGLNFMLKNKKDVLINDNAILEIFSAITRVDMQEVKAEKALPEEGVENYQQLVDAANAENEQVKQHNDAVNKLKAKISLQVPREQYARPEGVEEWHYPEDPNEFGFWNEKCYIRVQNYKDAEGSIPTEESSKPTDKKALAAREAEKAKLAAQQLEVDPNAEPPFEIERISNKIMVIPCQNNAASVSVFVHHTDASHFIRRAIVERAQKIWPKDLKEINLNQILGHCATKSKVLEEKLSEFIENRLEWGTGQMYEDRNVKIVFNTFLKSDDYRVDNDVLDQLVENDAIAAAAQQAP